jgi:hypothetical protein
LLVDSITRIRAILQICYTHKFNVEKGDKSWPADLDVLVKSGELKAHMLINPRFPDQKPGYIYLPPPENKTPIDAQTTIVLYESVPPGTKRIGAGFVDGHAQIMSAEEFAEALKQTEAAAKK